MNKSDITNIITVLIMAYGYSNDNNIVFVINLLGNDFNFSVKMN